MILLTLRGREHNLVGATLVDITPAWNTTIVAAMRTTT